MLWVCFSRGGSWIKMFVNVDEQVVATQILFSFIPKIGEDEPILTHIFQMG